MASVGLVFDPSDLDYGHISHVILRTVQLSLTPRIHSGRGDVLLVPKFVQRFYRDAIPVSMILSCLLSQRNKGWFQVSGWDILSRSKGSIQAKCPSRWWRSFSPRAPKLVRCWYASGLVGIDFLFGADMFPPDEQDKCRAQRSWLGCSKDLWHFFGSRS